MSAAAEARTGEHEGAPLRMKDLCAQTGLSRQAIHFYIHEGLVPEGKKTGRNMAWYGPEHVERLLLVRRLQEERFLPLKAIRALVGGDAGELAAAQRGLLLEVRSRLPQPLTDAPVAFEDLGFVAARHRVTLADANRLVDLGLLAVREHEGRREVSSSSEWLLNLWGQFRAIGFTDELGFGPDDLLIYDEAIAALFQRQARMLADRVAGQPADRLANMVTQALPLIHAILIHLHSAAVRGFFASLDAARPLGAPAATTDISEAP
ncbi:MAG: MerR family transcriptional regulator [Deltaproteobacteria bacterium]|nr:MerR family transcriptional regulator [Deltaproteobacteria bacterium]